MELDLTEAFKIAADVHGQHRDKAGQPYMFHVMRVAERMDTDAERVVALLHDTLEDSPSYEAQEAILDRVAENYGHYFTTAIRELTRRKNEEYMSYIRHLCSNAVAVKVKLADLSDNTNRYRMEKLAPSDQKRLRAKYNEAMTYLAEHGALMPKQ